MSLKIDSFRMSASDVDLEQIRKAFQKYAPQYAEEKGTAGLGWLTGGNRSNFLSSVAEKNLPDPFSGQAEIFCKTAPNSCFGWSVWRCRSFVMRNG